jgi:sorbitol-specific phosphotransferase system component IIA
MVAFLIDGVVVLFDKGAADEVADFYLGEFW